MSTIILQVANPPSHGTPGLMQHLGLWRRRRQQRARLAALDRRLLADIGISRAQALEESRKPFWQA